MGRLALSRTRHLPDAAGGYRRRPGAGADRPGTGLQHPPRTDHQAGGRRHPVRGRAEPQLPRPAPCRLAGAAPGGAGRTDRLGAWHGGGALRRRAVVGRLGVVRRHSGGHRPDRDRADAAHPARRQPGARHPEVGGDRQRSHRRAAGGRHLRLDHLHRWPARRGRHRHGRGRGDLRGRAPGRGVGLCAHLAVPARPGAGISQGTDAARHRDYGFRARRSGDARDRAGDGHDHGRGAGQPADLFHHRAAPVQGGSGGPADLRRVRDPVGDDRLGDDAARSRRASSSSSCCCCSWCGR